MTGATPRGSILLVSILSVLAAGAADEDYTQWSGLADLHLNTTADGAAVPTDVAGFPLLVRLSKYNFPFDQAEGRGKDVRFSKPDGTRLPYQIERWDSAAGAAAVWVRMDTVQGDASDQILRIHWGKADAEDRSSGAAVFDTADGWSGVWHMDRAANGERMNSVAGGNPAVPAGYEGDESRAGFLGFCDSLDGTGSAHDHLDLGDGYADFSAGFTFSIWTAPTANSFWSRLADLGNGEGKDNIIVRRRLTSNDLEFEHFSGTDGKGILKAEGAFPTGEWQHIAVTVEGRRVRVYRNGTQVATHESGAPLAAAVRTANWLGKSNWGGDNYYRGFLDEARIARRAEGADRVKLAWANQRAGQKLLSFSPPGTCAPVFDVPADTALGEGRILDLAGVAECATSVTWTKEEGPGAPVLDPEVMSLRIVLPRITADTLLRYRFTAAFGDSSKSAVVAIRIKEEIPDPVFTLPSPAWNGIDPLEIRAMVSNWGAVKASRSPDIRYAWTTEGMAADTSWKAGGLLLRKAAEGELTVGLCLDNGGTVSCKSTVVKVQTATGLPGNPAPAAPATSAMAARPAFDAAGRRRQAPAASGAPVTRAFLKPR